MNCKLTRQCAIFPNAMGTPQRPEPVKLIAGIMYAPSFAVEQVLERLASRFGTPGETYGPIEFSFTGYYAPEMGANLKKLYVCWGAPLERDALPGIKNWTNSIEQEFAADGRRSVNIDPGYLARDKLVLASTKDFFHRMYLGQGMYGEVTLHFRQGAFRHFSWTYPDFKEEKLQEFLVRARAALVGDLRKSHCEGRPGLTTGSAGGT